MTEKEMKKVYDDEMENRPEASEETKRSYEAMLKAFDGYINAVDYDAFCAGYVSAQNEKNKGILAKIEDIARYMELAQNKVYAVAGNIDQRYFELNEDSLKVYYFEHYKTEFSILFDYILEVGNRLTELETILGIK